MRGKEDAKEKKKNKESRESNLVIAVIEKLTE